MDMSYTMTPASHVTKGAEATWHLDSAALKPPRFAALDRRTSGGWTVYIAGAPFHFAKEHEAVIFVRGVIAGRLAAHNAQGEVK